MFNTDNVKESTGSIYVKAGVSELRIINIISGESKLKKTPFIGVQVVSNSLEQDDEKKSTTFNLYTSPKALEYTLSNLKHIATKCVPEADFNKVGAESATVEEYANKLNILLGGKVLRMLVNGEEYLNKEDQVKVKPVLGFAPFAEAVVDGAAYPAVAEADSALIARYNADPASFVKKLTLPDAEASEPASPDLGTVGTNDDLPY